MENCTQGKILRSEQRVNGFTMQQVFKLYAYLVAYEDSGIQNYKSIKALLKEHPELEDLSERLKVVKCNKSDANQMKDVNFKALNNEIYFTKSKNNLFSFLSHLRNSIAHGNSMGYKGKILITDFENPKYHHPTNFSARGCVDLKIIEDFTNTLKLIEL